MSSGRIVQIIGAVIDVEFPRDGVPRVYDALTVDDKGLVLPPAVAPVHVVIIPIRCSKPEERKGADAYVRLAEGQAIDYEAQALKK